MSKRNLFSLFLLSCLGLACVDLPEFLLRPASAQSSTRVIPGTPLEQLQNRYAGLVARDPGYAHLGEWKALRKAFDQLAKTTTDSKSAASARFYAARVSEALARTHGKRIERENALGSYAVVYDSHPDSSLADDSLLFAARLLAFDDSSRKAARELLERLIKQYPESDLLSGAEDTLDSLGKGQRGGSRKNGASNRKARDAQPRSEAAEKSSKILSEEKLKEYLDSRPAGRLPIASKLKEQITVVIDPGHGGEEEGAHGVGGSREKDVVLDISLVLDELLRERLGAKTMLTRARDVTITLAERTAFANAAEADLFVSVHANASRSKRAKGIETYYLDNTNDKSSLRLAKRENQDSSKGLGDLEFILSDLIQNAKLDDSISLAHHIQDSLYAGVSSFYPGAVNLGVKRAPFYVLVGAHMPCVLVEVSFIDHRIEGTLLSKRSYQRLLAESIFDGVVSYLRAAYT